MHWSFYGRISLILNCLASKTFANTNWPESKNMTDPVGGSLINLPATNLKFGSLNESRETICGYPKTRNDSVRQRRSLNDIPIRFSLNSVHITKEKGFSRNEGKRVGSMSERHTKGEKKENLSFQPTRTDLEVT